MRTRKHNTINWDRPGTYKMRPVVVSDGDEDRPLLLALVFGACIVGAVTIFALAIARGGL